MTSGLQHRANIDLTFFVTLCQYFQSIHMHVLLHRINRNSVWNQCSFIYLKVLCCVGTQSTHMNVCNKNCNPYQTKNMHPHSAGPEQLQFRKPFCSSSALSSSHSLICYNPEHQTLAAAISACSQLQRSSKQETTRYFKWVVFTAQPSPLGCTIRWLLKGQPQNWPLSTLGLLTRSREQGYRNIRIDSVQALSGSFSSILYVLCKCWAE